MNLEPAEPVTPQTRLLQVLRRRGWILAVCLIVGAAAAFAGAHHAVRKYSAQASLLFQASQLDEKLFGTAYTPAYVDPQTQAQTNLNLVTLPVVALLTSRALGGDPSAQMISSSVAASSAGNSSIVTVTATNPSPAFAARLANSYARTFVLYRRAAQQSQALTAAQLIQRQLVSLQQTAPNSPQVALLRQRESQLRILASLQTGDVQVAQLATAPTVPSSPTTKKDIVLGALAGLLVGVFGVFLAERLNRKLVDEDDAARTFGLPILGTVPLSKELDLGNPAARVNPAEGEAFRLLRVRLRYFNVDRSLTSILITSANPSDGKTTVAWHLARAAAEISPDESVLLLEADLRRPRLSAVLGHANKPGLSDVISHRADLDEVITRFSVSDTTSGPSLDVLTAGNLPPNPTELMESKRMQDLLLELHSRYDFIVVDAPPASLVSDALPLFSRVDGVVVVTRVGQTDRGAARLLRDQLLDLRAPTLGLILNATGVSRHGYYGYGQAEYEVKATALPGA